jgi:hypothetical protein
MMFSYVHNTTCAQIPLNFTFQSGSKVNTGTEFEQNNNFYSRIGVTLDQPKHVLDKLSDLLKDQVGSISSNLEIPSYSALFPRSLAAAVFIPYTFTSPSL